VLLILSALGLRSVILDRLSEVLIKLKTTVDLSSVGTVFTIKCVILTECVRGWSSILPNWLWVGGSLGSLVAHLHLAQYVLVVA